MRRRRRAARAENKLCKRRHNSERASGRDEESRVQMLGEKRFFVVRRLIAFEPYWPTPCFPIPALAVIGGSRKTANEWAPIWRRGPKFAGYGWTPLFPPRAPELCPVLPLAIRTLDSHWCLLGSRGSNSRKDLIWAVVVPSLVFGLKPAVRFHSPQLLRQTRWMNQSENSASLLDHFWGF
jgi:hypothetical protein